VGIFHFTPHSGKADLALRVRLNAYSNVRVITETSDGKLHMSKRFVKASGGCSAPVGTNLEAAFKRMGKMKFKIGPKVDYKQSKQLQIAISHPNVTGMQMDQHTRMYAPAHYVKKIKITFNDKAIFWAETGISISENPNFIFYFTPQKKQKGFRGYPQISLSYFGESENYATEVVIGFILEEGSAVQEQRFFCKGDVRKDETIQTTLVKVIERADAKTVLEISDVSIIK
jgi:hypothetical protein